MEPTLPDSSRPLLTLALGGDAAALRRIVATMTPVIRARVGRVLLRRGMFAAGDGPERLQDLVQDVFMELFRDDARVLRAWNPARGLSLANWVGLIAEQRAAAWFRGRSRRQRVADLPFEE